MLLFWTLVAIFAIVFCISLPSAGAKPEKQAKPKEWPKVVRAYR